MATTEDTLGTMQQMLATMQAMMQRQMVQDEARAKNASAQTTRIVDAKWMNEVSEFDGRKISWTDWSFSFRSILESETLDAMDWAVDQEDVIDENLLVVAKQEEWIPHSRAIYRALALKANKGEAATRIRQAGSGNGLEAWKLLIQYYETRSRGRQREVYLKISRPTMDKNKSLLNNLESWEQEVREYEKRFGKTVDEDMRVAVLLEMIPGSLKEHIYINAEKYATYESVKEKVTTYIESKSREGDHDPLTLDVLDGKGKGPGKGGIPFAGYCGYCGRWGHKRSDCYFTKNIGSSSSSWNNSTWNSTGTKGKGKGKDTKGEKGFKGGKGKSGDKGKGKGFKGKGPPKGKGKKGTGKGNIHEVSAPEETWPDEGPEDAGECGSLFVLRPRESLVSRRPEDDNSGEGNSSTGSSEREKQQQQQQQPIFTNSGSSSDSMIRTLVNVIRETSNSNARNLRERLRKEAERKVARDRLKKIYQKEEEAEDEEDILALRATAEMLKREIGSERPLTEKEIEEMRKSLEDAESHVRNAKQYVVEAHERRSKEGKPLDPRMTKNVQAGKSTHEAWRKMKSRKRAEEHRKNGLVERSSTRIKSENAWFEWYDGEEIQEQDVIREGTIEGVEDDEQVGETKVRAPLTREAVNKYRTDEIPPWRKNQEDRNTKMELVERKWNLEKHRRGAAAKKNSRRKLDEKRKRKKIAECNKGEVCLLNGLGEHEVDYVRENLLIDSGASICACPKAKTKGHLVHAPEGQKEFSTANNQSIPNEGTVTMQGAFMNGSEQRMKFKVLDVKRMIASVSELTKSGHRVVFDTSGSYIQNKRTGRYIKVFERNGVYEVPMWVKRPKKEEHFHRQP